MPLTPGAVGVPVGGDGITYVYEPPVACRPSGFQALSSGYASPTLSARISDGEIVAELSLLASAGALAMRRTRMLFWMPLIFLPVGLCMLIAFGTITGNTNGPPPTGLLYVGIGFNVAAAVMIATFYQRRRRIYSATCVQLQALVATAVAPKYTSRGVMWSAAVEPGVRVARLLVRVEAMPAVAVGAGAMSPAAMMGMGGATQVPQVASPLVDTPYGSGYVAGYAPTAPPPSAPPVASGGYGVYNGGYAAAGYGAPAPTAAPSYVPPKDGAGSDDPQPTGVYGYVAR